MSDFTCPGCTRPMHEVRDSSRGATVQLHACEGCHGLYVPAFALLSLAEEKDWRVSALPPGDGDPHRDCPRCQQLMNVGRMATGAGGPTVQVDECPQCGSIFFDGGELDDALGENVSEEWSSGGDESPRKGAPQPQWWEPYFGFVTKLVGGKK